MQKRNVEEKFCFEFFDFEATKHYSMRKAVTQYLITKHASAGIIVGVVLCK